MTMRAGMYGTVLVVAVLSAVLANTATAEELYFPPSGAEWSTVAPREAGWDAAKLDVALDFAGERKSSGVAVLYRGRIMAERYWKLDPPKTTKTGGPNPYFYLRAGFNREGRVIEDVASVQKSVVSVLLGIAQEKGLLRISDPVSKYLGKGWSKAPPDEEARITLRHLVTMSSGLTEKLEYEAPPGTKWRYNTKAYALTRQAVAAAAKMEPDRLTKQWLTERIGMADSGWRPRPRVGGREIANPLGFATTARDLARFGLLVLADGVWKGDVILADCEYLRQSLSPSQQMNPSYGFLWWLNGHPRATPGGRKSPQWLIPDAPKDLVAAQGALGRKLYIVPSLGLVVTRLGDAPEIKGQEDFNNGFWKRIMAAR